MILIWVRTVALRVQFLSRFYSRSLSVCNSHSFAFVHRQRWTLLDNTTTGNPSLRFFVQLFSLLFLHCLSVCNWYYFVLQKLPVCGRLFLLIIQSFFMFCLFRWFRFYSCTTACFYLIFICFYKKLPVSCTLFLKILLLRKICCFVRLVVFAFVLSDDFVVLLLLSAPLW